ncbi:MAG TPA: hemerythrin family protein [Firmicutes bacterium]|nr:hemerythrin family protein [Bacillota bacterium]
MIKWKEEYRVGVALIDQQHQKLFEIANRAYNLLADEWRIDKYDDIIVILEELRDYALFHFSVEEEHMKKIGYQRFLSHKVEHDDFKEELNAVDLYKLDDDQETYLSNILSFVVTWIENHILKVDKQIADHKY